MTLRSVLLGSAAIFAFSGAAQASNEGLHGTYFAVEGGANWIQGNNSLSATHFHVSASSTTFEHHYPDFNTGWAILGTVGYAFDNNWRVELEGGYRHNSVDKIVCTFTSPVPGTETYFGNGELNEWTIMGNVLYDIHLAKRWTLSIGAGLGGDDDHFTAGNLGLDGKEWRFAYQGLAGLSYRIGDQTQLFVNYRYLNVDAPSYPSGTPDGSKIISFDSNIEKHTVTLGLRFFLYGEEAAPPPPPAPPPAPPAPPPPPPQPRQFIVFFGFNKFNLTAEAQHIVEEAAAAVKEFGAASVQVVGHTDSSGSNSYNQKLSDRRSHTVRSALEALGIPSDNIHTSGVGETELTIQTGDGVKEPQNRRATIDLD